MWREITKRNDRKKRIGAHRPLDKNITQQVGNRKFNNEWFGRNRCLTALIAKQSLAHYSVEWLYGPKSEIKGLFSKPKMINIQHWPWCQWNMICAVLKTTVNSELQNLTSVSSREKGTLPKNELRLGKYVLNGHPTQNCKLGTRVSFNFLFI
jgi:hypothetical protein